MLRNLLAFVLLYCAAHAQAQGFSIGLELWDRPRSARAVLAEAGVKQAVSAYLAQAGGRLVIHHGAHAESALQAEELRAWLVALAVESSHIGMAGDLKPGEALRMELQR